MNGLEQIVRSAFAARIEGCVHRVSGLTVEARGLFAPLGARCEITCRNGRRLAAEVIGFRRENTFVAPFDDLRGISAGDRIVYEGETTTVRVGNDMVGHVVDSEGRLLDDDGRLSRGVDVPLYRPPENPLSRAQIRRPLATGVRVIDSLVTVGRGQRMGIFSGSGVGKSMLLGMIARHTEASIVVIGLIGERSREVRDFVEQVLRNDGLSRCIVVAATSEESALRRIQAAFVATAIAEHFRDQGHEVLLLMDSLTRVATAQRELGLSCGEPPTTRGYPPSVFALLPRLLERAGPTEAGSVTGFFSVLVEADDRHDPIADSSRGILDGHLWLSRDLAEKGHFPAIDPLSSLSRAQSRIVTPQHLAASNRARAHLARHRQVEDFVRLGAYSLGTDPQIDASLKVYPEIEAFLRQSEFETSELASTVDRLVALTAAAGDVEEAVHD